MTWFDTAIVVAIVVAGFFIFYRALKEPADAFFGLIGRGIGGLRNKVVDAKDTGGNYYDEIRYG